jgi:hypothetical protein
MCFGGPLPEKKSEENVSRDEHEQHSKQNDRRSSHSAGCHGGAGDIKVPVDWLPSVSFGCNRR